MEKVIDRKEYRRNSEENKMDENERVEVLRDKIRIFLLQSLGASIVFLIISFLKFYNCSEVLLKINNALDSQISLSSLQKSGQIIYSEATKYYTKLNKAVENILNNEFINNSIIQDDNLIQGSGEEKNSNLFAEFLSGDTSNVNVSSISVSPSGSEYETAVEGINQMSEDAEYIRENYKMTVPVIGTITSEFGVRNSDNPQVSSYHSGLDIAANTGTQILAALDGEVIEAATDTYYGKYLKIKKDDITMIYAHCSKLLVKAGDKVKKGSLIAYVGNTGNSTGSHLHFELKYNDRLVNPTDVIDIE